VNLPTCPRCAPRKTNIYRKSDGLYVCLECKGMFDDDPEEGGTYSDRNPAARLMGEERRRLHKQGLRGSPNNRRF
jgi:ribosomal protein L37AE/L43A